MSKEKLPSDGQEICQVIEVDVTYRRRNGVIECKVTKRICRDPAVGVARVEMYRPSKTWPFERELTSDLQDMCDYHLMMWAFDHDDE